MSFVMLLPTFCSNVKIKPQLQLISEESLSHRTSNSDDHVRLDTSAKGFWSTSYEQAFVDARIFIIWPKVTSKLSSYYKNAKERRKGLMVNMSAMLSMATCLFSCLRHGPNCYSNNFYKHFCYLRNYVLQTYVQQPNHSLASLQFKFFSVTFLDSVLQ